MCSRVDWFTYHKLIRQKVDQNFPLAKYYPRFLSLVNSLAHLHFFYVNGKLPIDLLHKLKEPVENNLEKLVDSLNSYKEPDEISCNLLRKATMKIRENLIQVSFRIEKCLFSHLKDLEMEAKTKTVAMKFSTAAYPAKEKDEIAKSLEYWFIVIAPLLPVLRNHMALKEAEQIRHTKSKREKHIAPSKTHPSKPLVGEAAVFSKVPELDGGKKAANAVSTAPNEEKEERGNVLSTETENLEKICKEQITSPLFSLIDFMRNQKGSVCNLNITINSNEIVKAVPKVDSLAPKLLEDRSSVNNEVGEESKEQQDKPEDNIAFAAKETLVLPERVALEIEASASKVNQAVLQPEEIGKDVLVCDYCQSSAEKNRFGQREELLICKDCGNKAHPSCLNYSQELVEQIRADNSWQCIDCKACIVCDGTGDPDNLLFCDACDKGYHMQCHSPKLEQMPSGKWVCSRCSSKGKSVATVSNQQVFVIDDDEEDSEVKANMEVDKSKTPPPTTTPAIKTNSTSKLPLQSRPPPQYVPPQKPTNYMHQHTQPAVQQHGIAPVQPGHHMSMPLPMGQPQMVPMGYVMANNTQQPQQQTHVLGRGVHNNMNNILNPATPLPDVRSTIREDVLRALPVDVADWTVKDVSYYFNSHGYVEEGALLQEQEIDGRALLLMSRNDCLTGLRIKLGPALKIYHMHIHKLQMRTDFLG